MQLRQRAEGSEPARMRSYGDPYCASEEMAAHVREAQRERQWRLDQLNAELQALQANARRLAADVHEHDLDADASIDFSHILSEFLNLKWYDYNDADKHSMRTWEGSWMQLMLQRIDARGPSGVRFDKRMIHAAVSICNR